MPKADSDNSTSSTGNNCPSDKSVETQSTTPLNEQPGQVPPANQKEKRMRSISAAEKPLTLQVPTEVCRPRSITPTRRERSGSDPLLEAFETYRQAAARVAAAQIASEQFTAANDGQYDPELENRCQARVAEESAVLDLIKRTMPTTVAGALALAVFIKDSFREEMSIGEYQAALQDNLVRALERITGVRAPKVTPYYYNFKDVL